MSPFIFIIEQILKVSYELTGNYGISIILLSFAISLLLLPVFIYIERSKKKDDVVKKKMQPLIDEIKRVYKGQERYYYIKTINRQHNYSSFKALIPILSLLLQIPFFIAAYQFLESFEPLKEVSFWFIPDLSQADGFWGIVNILPIIMTVVNIITVYYYTINGDKSERKQMLVLAFAFLVLLFNLPAGLVLYWTMNNVFSFFRLFITNPEVFKRKSTYSLNNFKSDYSAIIPKVKITFIIIALAAIASQLSWAFNHNFDDILLRIIASLFISFILSLIIGLTIIIYQKNKVQISEFKIDSKLNYSLIFLAIYFYLASQYYFTGVNETLGILSIFALVIAQVIGYFYVTKSYRASNKILFWTSIIVLTAISYYQYSLYQSMINSVEMGILSFNLQLTNSIASLKDIFNISLIILGITSVYYIRIHKDFQELKLKPTWLLITLSLVYIFGLIFFWNPMIVYSSYPENFDFPAYKFLTNNFLPFIISTIILLALYVLSPKKLKSIILKIVLSLVAIVLLYSSIIPFDVGTLQINFFSEEGNLAAETHLYLLEGLLIIAVFLGASFIIKPKHFKHISYGLIILNIFVIGQGLYLSMATGKFFSKGYDDNGPMKEIHFSKNKENVLFFIIDGAQGWFTKDILEENPEFKSEYDGFIWYPNTISTSNFTYASAPAMMSGNDYTIANMNKDLTTTIRQKVTNATNQFYDKVKSQNYFLTAHHLSYATSEPTKVDNHLPKWDKKWSKILNVTNQKSMWFTQLWQNALFSSMPLFIKPIIYNHNKWFKSEKDINEKEITSTVHLNKYSFLKILSDISNAESDESNFIFIHSLFAHAPWDRITEDNKLISDVSPYSNQKQFMELFSVWMTWMKENGVYDNTKIILASDHGRSWWHYKGKANTRNIPIVWKKGEDFHLNKFLRLNPLMLIKDFNSHGDVKEDWRLMSNADTYAIAFNENDPTKIDLPNRTVNTYYTKWHTDLNTRKQYKTIHAFNIKDNVYDLNNWEEIKIDTENSRKHISASDVDIYDYSKIDKEYIRFERERIVKRISGNYDWFKKVKEQAVNRKITVDSMLVNSANYVIKTSDGGIIREKGVLIYQFRNDPIKMAEITKEAEKNNVSIEKMLRVRAVTFLNNNYQ